MLLGLISSLILLIIILLLIRNNSFFQLEGISTKWIYSGFFIKIIGGVLLFLLYSYYYQDRLSADIFKYYDDALVIYEHENFNSKSFSELFLPFSKRSEVVNDLLRDTQHWDKGIQFLANDNRMMIRLNLLLLLVSGNFYLFHLLFFSILSFIGCMALFHFFRKYSSTPSNLLLAFLILSPSILLWTSGMLKESLFIFLLGIFLFSLMKLKEQFKPSYLIQALISFALLSGIKSYLLICLLPSIFLYLLHDKIGLRKALISSISILTLSLFLFKERFELEIIRVQSDFIDLAESANANSKFEMIKLNDWADFIFHIPQALYNVWLRPLIPNKLGLLDLISSAENGVYLLFIALPIVYFKKPTKKSNNSMIILFSLLFLLLASILIGSTVPIIGAIVRYRSPLIIFYLLCLFTFVDWKKIIRTKEK